MAAEKWESLKTLPSLIIMLLRTKILPFKYNNFPVFSLLKTELEFSDYPIPGESGVHAGFNR